MLARFSAQSRARRERASLAQFVALSLLVHLLVIVLFRQPLGIPGGVGDRTPFISSLEMVLLPRKPKAAIEAPGASALWRRLTGTPDQSAPETRRSEITPRERSPIETAIEPPAQGAFEPLPRVEESLPQMVTQPPSERFPVPEPPALPDQPLAPFKVEPPRAIEPPLPQAPELPPPMPLPTQPLPRIVSPARPMEREVPRAPELPPAQPLPAQPLPRITPPAAHALEQPLAPAPDLPAAEPLPSQTLPRMIEPPSRPIEQPLPAAPELPAAAPLPSQPLPHVEAPATRTIERVPVAPELPAAVPLPSQPLPRVEAPATRAIERVPLAPELPPAERLPSQALPRVESPSGHTITPAPSLPAPRGVPDAEPSQRLFLPAPPLIEPKAIELPPGRFDFERAREVAREYNRSGKPIDFEPPPGERVTPLGRAIQKAAQPDCREAYAALGLLGLVPLIADTVLDRGCRW